MIDKEEVQECYDILRITVPLDDLTTDQVMAAWCQQANDIPYAEANPAWPEIIAAARDTLFRWLEESRGELDQGSPSGLPRKPYPIRPDSAIALPLPDPEESDET